MFRTTFATLAALVAAAVTMSVGGDTAGAPPVSVAAAAVTARPMSTANSPRCASHTAAEVRDGRPMVVKLGTTPAFAIGTLRAENWKNPASSDPSWRLNFFSFRWAMPYLQKAVDTGQTASAETIIAQVQRFYREYPDTGSARTPGWDEGNSLRRLEALTCFYEITKDKRFVPPMEAEATVLFSNRYYGPPNHPVHNHGLMANERLVKAGLLIGRKDWVERAAKRAVDEAHLAFTDKGTTTEQSSEYQRVNAQMWANTATTLATVLPGHDENPTVRNIRTTVAQATNVSEWLTEPDGKLVQIGDSKEIAGNPAPARTDAGVFRDDVAGLAVGRWSWKDPATTYYSLRYGPARFAHGHLDKGALTWSTAGSRVLVGSGYYGYDWNDPFAFWARQAPSANLAVPVATPTPNGNRLSAVAHTARAGRHNWTLRGNIYPRTYTRTVDVNDPGRTLTVTDAFSGRGAADQYWHLDPSWQVVSAPRNSKVARFRNDKGQTLTLTSSAPLAQVIKGGTRPVAGWHFPSNNERVEAWQIRVRWNSGTIRTTLTVK